MNSTGGGGGGVGGVGGVGGTTSEEALVEFWLPVVHCVSTTKDRADIKNNFFILIADFGKVKIKILFTVTHFDMRYIILWIGLAFRLKPKTCIELFEV